MSETDPEAPRLSLTDVFGAHDTADEAALLSLDPGVTIRARPSDPGGAQKSRLEELRTLAADPTSRFVREEEIARGGMGVVRVAEQRALGRRVAMKELRADVRSARTAQALLQEAWVLGSMEHPNVVPVHDLMLDDRGDPVVVLKRIEGESWRSLIEAEERLRALYGATDPIEWHLGVLMQVCNALSFAHTRGILHRDVKPDNVMVGRFGEVYLVDWGVAVALADDGTGRFPLASEVRSLAGTPRYMAPEMLGGRAAKLDLRTDVYLLGATLYHVLCGRAPHPGGNIVEIATHVAVNDPDLPPSVPARLAEICRTAMARAPADRFESAEAFRAALSDFLRRRDALLLADEGEAKLVELRALSAAPFDDPEAHRLRMFNTYSESRLGFRLARRLWADSAAAQEGLQRATETMVEYLLDRNDVESATTLVRQLESPLPEELAARFDAKKRAQSALEHRLAKLEELTSEHDPAVGSRARLVAYALLAGLFAVSGAIGQIGNVFASHAAFVAQSAGLLAALAIVGWIGRRALLSTALSRRIFYAVGVAFCGKLLVHATVAILDHPPWQGLAFSGLVYFAVGAMLAIHYQKRLAASAIGFAAAALGSAALPDVRYALYAAASLLLLANLVWVHRVERRAP